MKKKINWKVILGVVIFFTFSGFVLFKSGRFFRTSSKKQKVEPLTVVSRKLGGIIPNYCYTLSYYDRDTELSA